MNFVNHTSAIALSLMSSSVKEDKKDRAVVCSSSSLHSLQCSCFKAGADTAKDESSPTLPISCRETSTATRRVQDRAKAASSDFWQNNRTVKLTRLSGRASNERT